MDVVWAVASKVSELTVEPIGTQLGYLVYYRSNLNELKEQLEKLAAKRESLQHAVEEDRRSGREIESNVKKWFDRVNKIKAEAEKFNGEGSQANIGCSYKSCPNLWLLYKWSRRAKKMADEIKMMEDGKFDRLSYTKLPEWPASSSTLGGDTFESRVRTLSRIMEVLADPATNMVGVHGLPGVGKTTLAKEVASKAKEEKLYDTVVMVEVKQKPDIKTIQREMAEMVGLKFDEDSQVIRASRLNERLRQGKKLLVILDDLWERLDLQKIGIPFGEEKKGGKISLLDDEYKGCKIFLTSRSEERLFKEMAELHDDSPPDLLTIANEVNERCARLPLAIVTVARALRNKSLSTWRDALRQLQQPSLRKVPGLKDVDSSIKLSYDYLEGRDLKSFFLLSAMLSNDAMTSDLFKYCIGLGLFEGIYIVEESLDRLQTMMKTLKVSCLLLDGSSSDHFKMHDVVRDSALSIAFNEKCAFVKRYEKIHNWPDKGQLENYKYLCFRGCDIDEPPPQLNCPSLELFLFESKHDNLSLPDDIFKRMPLLRVLTHFNFSSLPTPITSLENLTSLCLHQCELKDIAMIGVLRNLKVLSLTHSIIQELPHELACLTRLQLLDLSNCRKLAVIPQNTISRLNKLEALYLENSFNRWQD
ncbi:hypothetical protein L6164_036860 [Bauhinia variegata]|uniref:Uncharacterized protein n=1 Tax=Bauhinia variegata TaxID=167791 RepID=A0ACB9KIH5_BAUVA|nr:hypothetical protein L6164_036860 [Bauhinia variegata]